LAPGPAADEDSPYMHARWAIALAFALVSALATGQAYAWQEAHQTGHEAVLVVDARGVAVVEHRIRWQVAHGPLRSIDLLHFPASADVDPLVSITASDGRALSAYAARLDDGTVRIRADEPRALLRGTFTFTVHSRIDLVAARALVRDGGMWRLSWSEPAVTDGVDGARLTVDLPAAPDEPRPVVPETGAIDESVTATIQRGADRDVLDLVHAHVARGEAMTWTIRLDPRALALAVDPRALSPAKANSVSGPGRWWEVLVGASLLSAAVSFGMLVQCKSRAFGLACALRGGIARALLPLPDRPRAILAGIAFALGLGLGLGGIGDATAGAACAAIATLAAALRAPRSLPRVRGPGRWLALRAEDAFALPEVKGHWLDIDSAVGRAAALGAGVLAVVAALLARRFDPDAPWVVALDATALVPLFITGRASQLPPDGVRSAVPWLARAFRRLRTVSGVRVTPWARVAPDGLAADELRLLVMPRVATPGLIGLEVGLAWSSTPVGWAATPEVLVRVVDGSAAAQTLVREVPSALSAPGRRSDERVIRLLPHAPTRSCTVALVGALAGALTPRQAATGPSTAPCVRPDARRLSGASLKSGAGAAIAE